jgi:hypothetical protein
MNQFVDPFDLNDPRLEERLGEFGALLRRGGQLLTPLGEQPSLKSAATGIGALDEYDLKALALASVVFYKRSSCSPDGFKLWLDDAD